MQQMQSFTPDSQTILSHSLDLEGSFHRELMHRFCGCQKTKILTSHCLTFIPSNLLKNLESLSKWLWTLNAIVAFGICTETMQELYKTESCNTPSPASRAALFQVQLWSQKSSRFSGTWRSQSPRPSHGTPDASSWYRTLDLGSGRLSKNLKRHLQCWTKLRKQT